MAATRAPEPVLLVVAAFSRHVEALAWAAERLEACFGPVGFMSLPYAFNQTGYYEPTMGPGLRKQFLTFDALVAADALAALKRRTNDLEQELARSGRFAEPRPL